VEDRLEQLKAHIKKHGVGVSDSVEKDILKIMAGQNLEATPHMKLFWQQQMKFRCNQGKREGDITPKYFVLLWLCMESHQLRITN
jgi:hypothetical protein